MWFTGGETVGCNVYEFTNLRIYEFVASLDGLDPVDRARRNASVRTALCAEAPAQEPQTPCEAAMASYAE